MANEADPDGPARDAFEGALREAWKRRETHPGASVLAAIEARGGSVPRVLLREHAEQDAPVAGASGAEATGYSERYQVSGELGRGGVGVVLRGRDVDLGREVALKVLRAEHADNPDVLRRFIEEAQIGGQLQHPGVVPVYELGVRADRRPYFTMKLVKGKTLAALLAERGDVRQERHRFLTIFAQVCQTVAYAHSRGVIHRDLKPANVMVGSFGQVQVVDWGFAKLLATGGAADARDSLSREERSVLHTIRTGSEDSASHAGSVMGTPAYMPPEQALGQVDRLDTRCDVFALGAILLEILTGRPPYVPEAGNLLVQAARSDLTDAFTRLEASGADPALVDLTRRCLAPGREERPQDAGRVAEHVTGHLAAVEERAREAQVEAARAEVRAADERKARRLTLGLAAAAVLAVLLGGSGLYLVEAKEQERQEQAGEVVRGAMEEARRLQGEAQGDRDLWPAVVLAAERALALAEEQSAGPVLVESAAALLAEVRASAARALANAELLAGLAEIRATRGDQLGLKAADEAYARAFAAFDLEQPSSAAAALAETGIGAELAAFLDDWSWLRGIARLPHGNLRVVADELDPDPWRSRLRQAAARGDLPELEALAQSLGEDGLRRAHLPNLLALHLASLGEPSLGTGHARAADVLRQAQRLGPGDFWLNYQLGFELTLLVPPRWEEAIGFFRVALAGNPHSIEVRHQLAIALFKTARYAESVQVLEDLLRTNPDTLHAYDHLIEASEREGTLHDLIARWERGPSDWREHYRLGRAREVKGDWEGVVASYERALALQPSALLHARIGFAREFLGQLDEALASHARALEIDPQLTEAGIGIAFVHYQRNQYEEARAEIERRIAADPFDPVLYDIQGAILGDLGRHEEAVAMHETFMRIKPESVSARVRLGGIRSYQGELDLAEEILTEATRLPERFAEGRFQIMFLSQPNLYGPGWVHAPMLGFEAGKVYAYSYLGSVLGEQGRQVEAADACGQAVAHHPNPPAWLHANFALALQLVGRSQEAYEQATTALRLDSQGVIASELAHDLVGWAAFSLGKLDEARAVFSAIQRRYRDLRDAQGARGEEPSVSEERLRLFAAGFEDLLRLRPSLAGILEGRFAWSSDEERLMGAWMLEELSRYRASARLYEEVFLRRPELMAAAAPSPEIEHWGNYAARSAIRAALGYGADAEGLIDEERLHWRRRLREWLEREYATWVERAQAGDAEHARQLPRRIRLWTLSPTLAPVRLASNLRRLPAEERLFWEGFWERVRRD